MYTPHFTETHLERSSIIGAVPNFDPLIRLVNSKNLKFYSKFHHEMDSFSVPNNHILEHLRLGSYNTLQIKMEIDFKGKKYAVHQQIDSEQLYRKLVTEAFDIFYEMLLAMKHQLKLVLFDLYKHKETFDRIYTQMDEALRTSDIRTFTHCRTVLNQLEEEMNSEFEGYFMDTFKKPIETVGLVSLPEEKTKEELEAEFEREYKEIEERLKIGATKLRLTRRSIKSLSRRVSNKFVLPLDIADDGALEKFKTLTDKPFSFLEYNDAMFSVDLTTGVYDTWDDVKDQSMWFDLATKRRGEFKEASDHFMQKTRFFQNKIKQYVKVKAELVKEIDYLKSQFKNKADKFNNGKYLVFLSGRITSNIEKIRKAETIIDKKLNGMRNKKMVSDPLAFFNRMIKLYFGESGEDMLNDLNVLGLNTLSNASFSIKCIIFLLSVMDREDKFKAPVIVISQKDKKEDEPNEYGDIEILKVLAGHMFVHTVTIVKERRITTEEN